ncbi:hypothetical protein HHJ81_07950 [Mobiluncus mulieris]|uniref:Uncharacterized protein n=1 Tax=Mobiluncus mulieris TaxID=2052 RepID=A0A848RQ56_9ACTO|nr:hypothetical protein [Mobiluncus mulieris]MCU9972099.1 hypothetical protein [Mobiluncus mulieris]MCV0014874.1 hypothetical protein [Mobiluncus mulieris]NMW61017.1 hypothetical protein [Mobiluncus mulieris]NMW91879.1 hypothetical protein [Mobiluncus mulieris]NMW94137.1 hypothetical protein [Mobiluncus mulieris]
MLSTFRAKHFAGVILVLVPLVIFVLGVGGLTWMRPSDFVTVTSPPTRSQVVLTGKNVLESTAESVTITARAPRDTEVFLGIALTSDVQAFAAVTDHEVLADFSGKDSFVTRHVSGKKANSANSEQTKSPAKPAPHETEQKPAQPTQADAADLRKLDIWSQSATGKGTVSLKWTLSDSRWSAVAFVGNPVATGDKTAADAAKATGQGGKDAKDAKDAKSGKDAKDGKGGKSAKDAKDAKDAKAGKDGKGAKDSKGAKGAKNGKDTKGASKTGKTDSKTAAKTVGPTLQLKWHREPSLAPAWFMTIVGVLALLAVLVYITLSFISELRSKTRRAAAEEKDKTIRLAAEAVGEVEASLHPRRRKLRYLNSLTGIHEAPSNNGDADSLAADSENTGDTTENTADDTSATHEPPRPSRRERRHAKQTAVEPDSDAPGAQSTDTEPEAQL